MVNLEQENKIYEKDINTRPELWDSLFLFVDFSRLKEEYPNMWNKEYRMLPLPGTYQKIKTKFTQYCQELNGRIERLIDTWIPFFEGEILPVLESKEGCKELLFRCQRVLNNKIIGESSGVLLDLVIFEVEWRQQQRFKELVSKLDDWVFTKPEVQEQWETDRQKMLEGRINWQVCQRFWWKWGNKIGNQELVKEVSDYLKLWQKGKGAESEWKETLEGFKKARDRLFDLGSSSISDGKPFFALGRIKQDTEQGLEVATQNRKGFNLNNPYLFVVNFHQKILRVYVVRGYNILDPRRLHVSLSLEEDWVWRDYPWVVNSMGSLNTGNHPIYQGRNLE